MYVFEYFFPVFPIEQRRKFSHQIVTSYHTLQDGEYDTSDGQAAMIAYLYLSIQHFDMMRVEAAGCTNTRINPFEVTTYPPL